MKTKKIFSLILLVSLCASSLFPAVFMKEMSDFETFFSEDFTWDEADQTFYEEMLRNNEITPETVVDILVNQLHIQNVLVQNLYKRTNPINVRPLQDLPSLQPTAPTTCEPCDNFFGCKFFYNQTRKAYLSPASPFIECYVDFSLPDLLELLDKLDDELLPTPYDIPLILPLFTKVKMEERRAGGMFDFHRRSNSLEWRFQMPFYYIEHNFFLTERERAEIADAPLFRTTQVSGDDCAEGDDVVEEFLKEHVVYDRLGFGDTRIDIMYHAQDTECDHFSVGAELTIPTAITLKNGLIGRSFTNCPVQPSFSIWGLVQMFEVNPAKAQQYGTDLGVYALDRATRMIAATDLGGRSFGIGPVLEFTHEFDEHFSFFNRLRLHIYASRTDLRFFRTIKNPEDFNRDYDDPGLALQNLDFLSEQFVNMIYPLAAHAKINPGMVIQWTPAFFFDKPCFHWELGYDLWYRTAETLRLQKGEHTVPALDTRVAKTFAAIQHKVFGKVEWCRTCWGHNLRFGFFSDITFANKGIGKDWTLGFNLSALF